MQPGCSGRRPSVPSWWKTRSLGSERAGGFGLVIGVARGEDPEILRESGADVVVNDLVDLEPVWG
jgi:hypothetical protein